MKSAAGACTRVVVTVAMQVFVFAGGANADDFFKGTRGPTLIQMDNRFFWSDTDTHVEQYGANVILKYWDGTSFGKWTFINLPVKTVETPSGRASGFADLTVGAGPRFTLESLRLHALTYVGGVFPTAVDTTPALGNDRYDLKAGTLLTWLSLNSTYDANLAVERTFAGVSGETDPSDESYAGFFLGRALIPSVRAGAGMLGWANDEGDYRLDAKIMARWDFLPKRAFLELGFWHTVEERDTPSRSVGELQIRFNL